MIFQDPMTSLNPVLTIGRQIREALEAHFGMDRQGCRTRASAELLDQVGIPSAKARIGDYPHQFSGGMRQRAMIAMALACEPKLLIADEPTTALDVTIQAQILDLLRVLVAERDTALILITHDLGVVAGMCERVNVMYGGTFVETGSAEQVFGEPRHPVHARPAPERAASRHAARPPAPADRGRAARHAPGAARLPVPAALPLRDRVVPHRGAAARRGRARPLRGVLQPRARGRVDAVAPGEGMSENGNDNLVELENLSVWFPIQSGVVLDRHVGDVKAVDDVTLDDPPRRDARPGRRVGLREVDGRPRDPAPLRADRGHDRVRRPGHHAPRRVGPARAAAADADGVPGPVRLAQPAPQRRAHRRRAAARARPREAEGGRRARPRAAEDRRAPRGRGEPVPARVLGRPAPARSASRARSR